MATVAAAGGGVGLGGGRFHGVNSKLVPSFLGKKLKIRPFSESIQFRKPCTFRSKNLVVVGSGGGDLIGFVHDVFLGVGVGLPCTVMECGDIIYRSTLPKSNGITLTVPGVILAMGALSYLWATPGVAPGFFDMFVLAFVERLFRPTFKKVD